jgi:hypothetical protein
MSSKESNVEKAIGEPIALDFSDYVRKIRNGLITTSLISLALSLGGLSISPESAFLGLKFIGLTDMLIFQFLFYLELYFLLHFIWCSADYFNEWKLRVSGTRVAFFTAARFSSEVCDYPGDPRQSTLYNWWKDEAGKIKNLETPLSEIQQNLESWEVRVREALTNTNANVLHACQSIRDVNSSIEELKRSLVHTNKLFESNGSSASLLRFDSYYIYFLRSQNLRWFVIELCLPIVLGLYAIYVICQML